MSQGPAATSVSVKRLKLVTFGDPGLHVGDGQGVTVVLRPGKPLALIVYLASSPHHTARRAHLIDLLWSDRDAKAGSGALRQTLWIGSSWTEMGFSQQ